MPRMPSAAPSATPPAGIASPLRSFGRFGLRRLLGKSAVTMTWLAFDPQLDEEVMLTLPREQPADAAALAQWLLEARMAARPVHPHIAPVAEVGVQEHWPFIAVLRRQGQTLSEALAASAPPPPDQVAGWICDVLEGLAFAHEAGAAHLDLQLHSIVVHERGAASVMALAAGGEAARRTAPPPGHPERAMAMDTNLLRLQRAAAARDVLACGVLLHQLLGGELVLGQADVAAVIARLAPVGRELVRLPWSTPVPIPEALRAIANRSTSAQERLRYQNARTLLGALGGWREAHAGDDAGPVARLLARLHSVGHLPAVPGLAARVARITGTEGQRTDEMAEQALFDIALSFELLRTLNSAQVQSTQVAGDSPVLTLRRIISLIGVNGVRLAANTLRAWPGPLDEAGARVLQATIDEVRLAGHLAQALRPAGYDAQVVYLIAALQNLGRLMLRYHFADEAEQIRQLMQPLAASAAAGTPELPGMKEEQAAVTVLGVDLDSLGRAVARQWGLSDEILHMTRRLAADVPVRRPDTDADMLRLVASAANEAVDALGLQPPTRVAPALAQVVLRYGRSLGFNGRELSDAVQAARDAARHAAVPPRTLGRREEPGVSDAAEAPVEASAVDPRLAAAPGAV